jgi:hypothetical protein
MYDQFQKAAKKVNALAYKDGLVDLLIGVFFTFLAFQEPLEMRGLPEWVTYLPSFLAMGLGLMGYAVAKRKLVMPRIGRAEVSIRRNPARRGVFLFALALQLVTLLIYILASTGKLGEWLPSQSSWVIDAFFALAIFGFFAYLGHNADAPRFFLYGLLLGVTVLAQAGLRGDMRLVAQLPILISGLVMVAGGVFTLTSFLRRYPPMDLEAGNG